MDRINTVGQAVYSCSCQSWTIYVCDDCGRVQGFGGRCRNAFAHEAFERVMLREVRVVPACATCGGKRRVLLQHLRDGQPFDENGCGLGWYWADCPACSPALDEDRHAR